MLTASYIALLICKWHYTVSAFAPTSTRDHIARVVDQFFHADDIHNYLQARPPSSTTLQVSPTVSADTITPTLESSQELLNLLLQKTSSINSKMNNDNNLDKQINSLVRLLIASKTPFDPQKCIDGPLFASVHFIGNTPLWEKIGLPGLVKNIKGQKYTLDRTIESAAGAADGGTFVNYAEIWGNNLYLMASGDFIATGPTVVVDGDLPSSLSTFLPNKETTTNPFSEILSSLFPSNSKSINIVTVQQSSQLPTPYDYAATVTGASIVLFQKMILNVSIEGTGTVRVLYADENLRIFVSPTDTNVTRGGGDWESEGLIVVQVRVDLVYDEWIDRL
jgi:hypothetical protein